MVKTSFVFYKKKKKRKKKKEKKKKKKKKFSPLQMCINIYVSYHPIVSQEDLRSDDSLKHYLDNAKSVDQKPTKKIKNLTDDEKTSIFESYPFNAPNPYHQERMV